MGRKRVKLTEEEMQECERLSAVGCTQAQMALFLGLTDGVFQQRLDRTPSGRGRISKAKISATAKVAQSLFKKATEDGDVTAQKAWLAAQGGAGWRPDAPQTNVTVNLSAALQEIHKVIDADASEIEHDLALVEKANHAKGYIEQDVTDDAPDESETLDGSDYFLTRNALRQIDKWNSDA